MSLLSTLAPVAGDLSRVDGLIRSRLDSDVALVRQGTAQGQVTATFELAPGHPVFALLAENGIDASETLILRRVQGADGRSRAFIDDIAVSVQLLRQVGQALVELHGQHDERALIDPSGHRDLVDAYGGLSGEARQVGDAYEAWQQAESERARHESEIAATLATCHAFPGRLLIFFQPHGYGPLRTMRRELVAAFAGQLGLPLLQADPGGAGLAGAEQDHILRLLVREAWLLGAVLWRLLAHGLAGDIGRQNSLVVGAAVATPFLILPVVHVGTAAGIAAGYLLPAAAALVVGPG